MPHLTDDEIRARLENGGDVNLADDDGKTPLMWACEEGRLDIVRALIHAGADVNAFDKYGYTPLEYAFKWDDAAQADILRALIEAGADVNASADGIGTPLISASFWGKWEAAKALVEAGANVNVKDYESHLSMTPLMHAADPSEFESCCGGYDSEEEYIAVKTENRRGSMAFLNALLHAGVNVNETDSNGWTALIHAIQDSDADDASVVKLLIEAGADVNLTGDKNGWTPIVFACRRGSPEVVKALLAAGANVHVKTKDGRTPWEYAFCNNCPELNAALIEAGADTSLDVQGLLYYAVDEKCHLEVIQALIALGANVNVGDDEDETPLMRTCHWGKPDVVKLLIDAGAKVDAIDEEGRTALMQICSNGYVSAISTHHHDWRKADKSCAAIAQLLLDAGADVNVRDDSGMSPLMWAANDAFPNTVQVLLDAGADIDAKDFEGRTALDLSRYDNIRELLLNAQKKMMNK